MSIGTACLSGGVGHAQQVAKNFKGRGDVYYDLAGKKALLLCFHGRGGSGEAWSQAGKDNVKFVTAMKGLGYSFVCPTSKDRVDKQWSPAPSNNPDVANVDGLLNDLGVDRDLPLVLVGHSNGGGFVTRYAVMSARKNSIVAVQNSNSSGIGAYMAGSTAPYEKPTKLNYAVCDPVVAFADAEANIHTLQSRGIPTAVQKLDDVYRSGAYEDCHKFVSTPVESDAFFSSMLNRSPNPEPSIAVDVSKDSDGDGVKDLDDCAPHDRASFKNLAYTFVDADGDRFVIAKSGQFCGSTELPTGYFARNPHPFKSADCNDSDPRDGAFCRWKR